MRRGGVSVSIFSKYDGWLVLNRNVCKKKKKKKENDSLTEDKKIEKTINFLFRRTFYVYCSENTRADLSTNSPVCLRLKKRRNASKKRKNKIKRAKRKRLLKLYFLCCKKYAKGQIYIFK